MTCDLGKKYYYCVFSVFFSFFSNRFSPIQTLVYNDEKRDEEENKSTILFFFSLSLSSISVLRFLKDYHVFNQTFPNHSPLHNDVQHIECHHHSFSLSNVRYSFVKYLCIDSCHCGYIGQFINNNYILSKEFKTLRDNAIFNCSEHLRYHFFIWMEFE